MFLRSRATDKRAGGAELIVQPTYLGKSRDARNGSRGQKCGPNWLDRLLVVRLKKELQAAQVS
jgi:hypothetical protein